MHVFTSILRETVLGRPDHLQMRRSANCACSQGLEIPEHYMVGYVDSNFASELDRRRSLSDYMFFIGGCEEYCYDRGCEGNYVAIRLIWRAYFLLGFDGCFFWIVKVLLICLKIRCFMR